MGNCGSSDDSVISLRNNQQSQTSASNIQRLTINENAGQNKMKKFKLISHIELINFTSKAEVIR